MELAKEHVLGIVSISNTSHWMKAETMAGKRLTQVILERLRIGIFTRFNCNSFIEREFDCYTRSNEARKSSLYLRVSQVFIAINPNELPGEIFTREGVENATI